MSQQQQGISLASLSLQQLLQLKKQFEQELQKLTNTIQLTNDSVMKSTQAKEELKTFAKMEQGKEMLVPITESLYVTGKSASGNRPIIELGTGFFVETSVEKADSFFGRRIARLSHQQESLKNTFKEKQNQYMVIGQIINQKIQANQSR